MPLHAATAFLFFNKGGITQNLIHGLKYKKKKNNGLFLGSLFGNDLSKSELFKDADLLIPVPLHPKKQQKRGYNQSELIARGMETSMNAKLNTTILKRVVFTKSQTKKSRFERWENVKDIFHWESPEELKGKHIILVDDVITTGATMEACLQHLIEIPDVKISVAAIAYSQV